jgi:isochorismate pyruvate lyase
MTCEPRNPKVDEPEHCQTMAEVRAGVDAVDRALIALLKNRFRYMEAAARIKQSRDDVRDEARKQQVIENVRAQAVLLGLPEHLFVELWDRLVEESIAYELERWDDRRG